MRFVWLVVVCFLVLPATGWAGAWLQEPGFVYARLSSGFFTTRERFDESGNKVQWDTSGGGFRNAKYQDLAVSFYAEAGVHREWTVITAINWKRLVAAQPSADFETYGFSDLYFGVRRSLWRGGRTVASATLAATLPTGYDVEEYPSLGADVADVSILGSAGYSGGLGWSSLDVEYRLRGGVFRNSLGGALGGGFGLGRRGGIRGELRGAFSVGSGDRESGGIRFDPATVDPSFLDVAGTAAYDTGLGFSVEGEIRSTVSGENTLSGTRFSLALATSPAWRWRR